MDELDLARFDAARDRRGARRLRRARERDVPFAGEQSGRRIEADPAGARQIDLAPGVEIGEIAVGARRSVQRFDVRASAGSDSPTRNAPRARDGGTVAPAATWCRGTSPCQLERALDVLHAGVEPDDVARCRRCTLAVDVDEQVDRPLAVARSIAAEITRPSAASAARRAETAAARGAAQAS